MEFTKVVKVIASQNCYVDGQLSHCSCESTKSCEVLLLERIPNIMFRSLCNTKVAVSHFRLSIGDFTQCIIILLENIKKCPSCQLSKIYT